MGAIADPETPGPLVGRDTELRAVAAAIVRVAAGQAEFVAICGESGIGKSRLAREALWTAARQRFRILEGAAGRLDRDLSYAPIVDALRPLVSETALVEGLSDLARLFEGLPVPPLVALGDPGLERTRMFEAVRTLLERASARQPLVIFLDDLHWADTGTIALVHYLVRGLPRCRCLFLVTYRADEAGEDLRELLAALRRVQTLTPVELAGLDAASTGDLATALLGGPAPVALRDMLVRRSGGVPLFVRAIALRLIETGALHRTADRWVLDSAAGAEVPALISTLLRTRIEALAPGAREALDLLVVCGGAAEHTLLRNVTDDLDDKILGVCAAGLAVEYVVAGALRYRVSHPILAEAAYDMIALSARRRLHARLAEAVRRHRPDDVRLLAAHVRAAGDEIDPEYALGVLQAAAQAELSRRAGQEARVNAGAALDIARRLRRSGAEVELAGMYAEACELAGPVEDALTAWRAAADAATDARTRARRLTRAAVVSWELGHFAEAQGLLESADRALAGEPPGPEHVEAASVMVRFAGRAGDLTTVARSISVLAALDRTVASPRPRAVMLLARTGQAIAAGRYRDGLAVAEELVTLARREESAPMGEAAMRPLTLLNVCWGDLAGARAGAEEGLRLAAQTGTPALGILHGTLLAFVDMLSGDWVAALRRTSDELDLAERLGVRRGAALALAIGGVVDVRRGRLDEVANRIGQARRLFGLWSQADRHVFAMVDLVEGMLALARGEVDRAVEIAAGPACDYPTVPPLALALLAEAQTAAGNGPGAMETAARLARLGPGAPYPAAVAAWVAALAAGARCDPARAVGALDRLDAAVAGFGVIGMPYEEAVARLDRAAVRRAAGHDADSVAADVTCALQTLDRLGAGPQADRARAVLRELGRRPARAARPPDESVLSAREQEVARLVAQGLSNAEVAARLYISARTVTTHLQNIYRRLALPSRGALIRYVLETRPAAGNASGGPRIRSATDVERATYAGTLDGTPKEVSP